MYKAFIKKMKLQIQQHEYLIGVAVGAGLTAKCVISGGADFLLILSSGKFRQMGRGSLAGLLPFANSNELVMELGVKEILPLVQPFPVFFGINASDPTIDLPTYLDIIKGHGFSGINNFPSVGLFDGKFYEALAAEGLFLQEVEAIRLAHKKHMLTIAFVFNEVQTRLMIEAGADILCVHLGLTEGGILGSKKVLSLKKAKDKVNQIFEICDRLNPDLIKMVYGGPIKNPVDVQYMYNNTKIDGYIGGSAFERIPSEESLIHVTKSFKKMENVNEDRLLQNMLDGITKHYDYVSFVKEYIAQNYMYEIHFKELAEIAHVSAGHLSRLFSKDTGSSFSEYLITFRMNKAIELMTKQDAACVEAANFVGYTDYAQFSKIFKKYTGVSPNYYKT